MADGVTRVQQSVSLQPDHERAIRFIAQEDGHGKVSRAVQELIEREMVERLGSRWRRQVRSLTARSRDDSR